MIGFALATGGGANEFGVLHHHMKNFFSFFSFVQCASEIPKLSPFKVFVLA